VHDLVVPLTVAGVVLLVLALVAGVFLLRRFVLTRDIGTFDCSMRRESGHSAGGWMPGVARYEQDRLDWFRLFALSPRPWRSLARTRLSILEWRRPVGSESYAVMPGAVIVRCGYGASVLELAMSELAYNGFATWLQSAPPGQHSVFG